MLFTSKKPSKFYQLKGEYMKKKTLIAGLTGLGVVCLCAYALHQYQQGQSSETKQTEQTTLASSEKTKEKENWTSHEDSNEEEIIVKITADGYATTHGDHYHYYNGKVPYDAIFSEELVLNDPDYVLKQEDIVSEIANGYIVLYKGEYRVYLQQKDSKTATNIRSKEEVAQQQSQARESANTGRQTSTYQTDDGYVFDPKDIVRDLGDAYIVAHGSHFHYIPKKDLTGIQIASPINRPTNLVSSATLATDDGYIFHPKDVVKELADGVVVAHGDHFHFIPHTHLTTSSNQATSHLSHTEDHYTYHPKDVVKHLADGVVVAHGDHFHFIPHKDIPTTPATSPVQTASPRPVTPSLPVSPTVDEKKPEIHHLAFDASKVTGKNELGYLVPHGDHYDLFFFKDLSEEERQEAEKHLATLEKTPHTDEKEEQTDTAASIEAKKRYLAEVYYLNEADIHIAGDYFVYPHGHHSHTIKISDVIVGEYPTADSEDEHDHHDHDHDHAHSHPELEVGMKALEEMGLSHILVDVLVHSGASLPFPGQETDKETLEAYLDSVHSLDLRRVPNPFALKGLDRLKNIELVAIGSVPVKDMEPIFQFPKLKTLWMTKIEQTDFDFLKRLPNLEDLDISENQVANFDFLAHLPNLKRLKLNNTGLTDELASNITVFETIEELEVDRNQLTNVDFLKNNHVLTRLFASENLLQNLDGLVSEKVKGIYAYHNHIRQIPSLSNMKELEFLHIPHNHVTSLEGLQTEHLRDLVVNHNQIESLDLTGANNLRNLNATSNRLNSISQIPSAKLRWLYISNNQLNRLDLSQAHNLRVLEASSNQLSEVLLAENSALEVAYLDHNQLTSVTALHNQPELNEVYLSHNQIHSIAGLTQGLPMLGYIDLSHNLLDNKEELILLNEDLYAFNISNNLVEVAEDEFIRPDAPKLDINTIVAQVEQGYLVEEGDELRFIFTGELSQEEQEAVHHRLATNTPAEDSKLTDLKQHYLAFLYRVPLENITRSGDRFVIRQAGYYYAPGIEQTILPAIQKVDDGYHIIYEDQVYPFPEALLTPEQHSMAAVLLAAQSERVVPSDDTEASSEEDTNTENPHDSSETIVEPAETRSKETTESLQENDATTVKEEEELTDTDTHASSISQDGEKPETVQQEDSAEKTEENILVTEEETHNTSTTQPEEIEVDSPDEAEEIIEDATADSSLDASEESLT